MLPSTKLLLAIFLLFTLFTKQASTHECVHDQIDIEPEINTAYSNDNIEGRVLQSYSNIRIAFDQSALSNVAANIKSYILDTIIPPSKSFLEKALTIIPLSSRLKTINSITCGSIPVPAIYRPTGAGIDADLLIFLTVTNEPSASYLAYASACEISNADYRPIVGMVNFNLGYITPTTNQVTIRGDISTTLHEIVHVLGFSSGLYSYFINPITRQKLTGHVTWKIVNGQNITVVNIDPLTSRIQTYFACTTVEGAYIENEGGSGSAGSHFERRVFYNDFMTASAISDERVTEFSLAFLEGTGWYKSDYTMAEPFTWGKGKGCPFLDSTCLTSGTTAAFPEFCDVRMQESCSWTRRGISYCPYQTNYTDSFADNCPYAQVYSNTDCEDAADQRSNSLEIYGYGSKCFTGNLNGLDAFCLKSTCEAQGGGSYNLKLQIGSITTVTCTSAGTITVPSSLGSIECPDPTIFCNSFTCKSGCFGRGTCVNKVCQCNDGWSGDDCNVKQYKDSCTRCATGFPYKTSCYGDSCECNPSDITCMCRLNLITGAPCAAICMDGWSTTDCAVKVYKANCGRCASGFPYKTYCYGDSCECNPTDITCMCRLNLITGAQCSAICGDGWSTTDCGVKEYKDNCARCANGNPFKTTCYGDSCECNATNTTCMCRLNQITGAQCSALCVDGWSTTDCGLKVYVDNCARCATGFPYKTSCYGDTCDCNPADTNCMCRLNRLPRSQCSSICVDGYSTTDCAVKVYQNNCARCANGQPFKTFCYGDSCECDPSDLSCNCHLGLISGAQCTPYCGDGWDPSNCGVKQYADNCTRCANGDLLKTSCYGDTCECNPSDLACMCHLGRTTGTQCDSICNVDGWDPTDCTKKVYKAACPRCASGSDPLKTYCYGDTCAARPVDPDGSKPDIKATEEDDGAPVGLIIGAAVGGAVILSSGTFFGVKAAKSLINKRATSKVTQIQVNQTSVISEPNRPGNMTNYGETSRIGDTSRMGDTSRIEDISRIRDTSRIRDSSRYI